MVSEGNVEIWKKNIKVTLISIYFQYMIKKNRIRNIDTGTFILHKCDSYYLQVGFGAIGARALRGPSF